jgi:probable F420-dependent oxidoreductase
MMDLGISIRHAIQLSPNHVREIAIVAESRGFRTAWVPSHTVIPAAYESSYPYSPDQRLPVPADTVFGDALGVLSYIAAVTQTLKLSTGVIPIIAQHPLALAKQAATTDLLSGGRLELGLGAGWLKEEAEVLGLPTDRRGARLDETIEVLRKAWTGKMFSHDGIFWQIPDVCVSPAPAQGTGIPLWIGGGGARVIRTIASKGFGAVLPPPPPGAELLPGMRAELRADAQIAIPLEVSGEDSIAAAPERCREFSEAGASQVVLITPPDPQRALEVVERVDVDSIRALVRGPAGV